MDWSSETVEGKVAPDENWMPPYNPPAFLEAIVVVRVTVCWLNLVLRHYKRAFQKYIFEYVNVIDKPIPGNHSPLPNK